MKFGLRPVLAISVAAGLLTLSACSSSNNAATTPGSGSVGSGSQSNAGSTINIVGFAVPEAANKAISAKFVKTDAGKGVEFKTSYGASGDQSRAVVNGLPADYVHLSVSSDVTRLVDANLVAKDWNAGPNKGVVSSSVVVFAVREGNPKNIKTWDDLIKPGVGIVTPNPGSSGAARWNALAAYGQVISSGGTPEAAAAYLDKFFANVVSLPGSGRDATTSFLGGTGDVLMAYENEAILARQNGEKFDYIIPDTTMLIENPGAILIKSSAPSKAFLDFVLSKDGQAEFAKKGFRPIIEGVDYGEVEGANDPSNPFPAPKTLLTVSKNFESWSSLSKKFFDEKEGIVTKAIATSGKGS